MGFAKEKIGNHTGKITKLVHFIGKDNIVFIAWIFSSAMLKAEYA
jgi:methionyl-tRNA synthetase